MIKKVIQETCWNIMRVMSIGIGPWDITAISVIPKFNLDIPKDIQYSYKLSQLCLPA